MPRDTNTKRWSKEEDVALRDIVEQWQADVDNEGRAKWPAIADDLKVRTGIPRAPKQCRERYKNVVAAGVVVGQWTEADDAVILQRHTEVGNKWVRIAQFLPGRPENSVKNRYHSLLRRAVKGDQYPVQVAKKAGGASFLRAVEAKVGGTSKGGARAARGTKRRRTTGALPPAAKLPALGPGRAGMPQFATGGLPDAAMFTASMHGQAPNMFMPLNAAVDLNAVGGGPHSYHDIAAATAAASQAAAAMQENLASMDTDTQIAMIAAAMTGSADVDAEVTAQLHRCTEVWKGLLGGGGMMSTYGALPGYPMFAMGGAQTQGMMAAAQAPFVAPTSIPGLGTAPLAAPPAPASAPPAAPSISAVDFLSSTEGTSSSGGPGQGEEGAGASATDLAMGGVSMSTTVTVTAPSNTTTSVVATVAGAGTTGGTQTVVDPLGRQLSITIPTLPSTSAQMAAAGAATAATALGFQLPGGALSSGASPMFMFSPGNTPFGMMGVMPTGGTSGRSADGGEGIVTGGTPTAFFVQGGETAQAAK